MDGASSGERLEAHDELDLRGVICPYNFVKTKLKLDMLHPGQILSVILDEGEPIQNVPQSIRNEGHQILHQEILGNAHRILIRKQETEGIS
jgi:TusA-related sulfurtransferase